MVADTADAAFRDTPRVATSFRISGTASALPERVVTNDELAGLVDTDNEWIVERTGIHERRVFTGREELGESVQRAAREALAAAGRAAGEIDLIIGSSTKHGHTLPSLAALAAEGLGVSGAWGFDVVAACAGFVAALDVARGYFATGQVRCVLVVCAEALSFAADWTDRSSCVLFGDGVAAAVLTPGDSLRALKMTLQPQAAPLSIPNTTGNSPFVTPPVGADDHIRPHNRKAPGQTKDTPVGADDHIRPHPPQDPQPFIHMQGREVFKFAVKALCADIEAVLTQASLDTDDIRHFVVHQANRRILDAAIQRLGVAPQRFPSNIATYGNTASASVPLLLDELLRSDQLQRGDKLVLSAFGAGLLSGACVLEW